MTTTDTLSTGKPINSELEAKRQAVLASIKLKKSSQNSSRNQSPALVTATLNPPSIKAHHQNENDPSMNELKNFHNMVKSDLYDAILDLRSLGYSFEKIVQKSGVNRDFLAQCYSEFKFPVPRRVIEPVVNEKEGVANVPNDHVHMRPNVPANNGSDFRSGSTPPMGAYQRPMFNNKVYRANTLEKPEWLKNLVIDLAETSDEEDDDEGEEEEEDASESETSSVEDEDRQEKNEEKNGSERTEESNSSDDEGVTTRINEHNDESKNNHHKRRRLSNDDLNMVKNDKHVLHLEIKQLSNEIKTKEESLKNRPPIIKLQSQLKEKVSQLDLLKKQVEKIEAEVKDIEVAINNGQSESDMFLQLKSRLADKLVDLDERDQEEKRLMESEKRRLELKEKLIKQIKLKKQRNLEESQKREDSSNQSKYEEEKKEDYKYLGDENDNNSGLVSAETIHKIPKVINLF